MRRKTSRPGRPATIDSAGVVGMYSSVAVDGNNKVHISYYDSTNMDLKYATNALGSWATATVDTAGDVGQYSSIAIDANNKVHISYYDSTNADLKYATNASGIWVLKTIDSNGSVGASTSIAVDKNKKVHIGYYDGTNRGSQVCNERPDRRYAAGWNGQRGWGRRVCRLSDNYALSHVP